ncbi:MAG: hydrogenase expression/formation protein HypE [Bdellovibrio sp.]|nr:hydrogenase expression/formation protein HypE [Bdellovibrio sp.]
MNETIELFHGSGAKKSHELIREVFFKAFRNPLLEQGADGVVLAPSTYPQVMATDAFVVRPLFFPGGDLGKLAICGPLNDLTAMGARALYLSVSFILEEGLEIATLKKVVSSMGEGAREAGVNIVAGDTKVVEKNKGDQIFISVTALGQLENKSAPHPRRLHSGQKIILTGPLGNHGATVLAARKDLAFEGDLRSDCANLQPLILPLLEVFPSITCMRDPTRGGLIGCLHELIHESRDNSIGFHLLEENIAISPPVHGLCDILGLDPLTLANEGKMIIFCNASEVQSVLQFLRNHPLGKEANVIGEVTSRSGQVELQTLYGGERLLMWQEGDSLPRIC